MMAWIRALAGIAFGLALLWLAVARIDMDSARDAMMRAEPGYLCAALAFYWLDIALRTARWRLLLAPAKRLAYRHVGEALLVGYAMNNVLPARLGEIFRADFICRQFAVSRSAALGSIIIERMLDGITVVGFFVVGLATVTLHANDGVLTAVAITAGVGLTGGAAIILGVVFWQDRLPLDRLVWLKPRLAAMAGTFAIVRGPAIVPVIALTAGLWLLECTTIFLVIAACGVTLSPTGLCLVVGVASLSTLIPSAPGYIGSLQLAFVMGFAALGIASIPAVIAATLTQILLLGSITVAGLSLLGLSGLRRKRSLAAT